MKNSFVIILLGFSLWHNIHAQTFRNGFDKLDYSSNAGNGQGASHYSNLSSKLHNDESVFLLGCITMFQATHDKRYLDKFIIHAKRVQERRDDNITQLPFYELYGFPVVFLDTNDVLKCQILGLDQIDPNSQGWAYTKVDVDTMEAGMADDVYFCNVVQPAVVQSGEITYSMALFAWYMQSDPAFAALANEIVPTEAQTVLASTGCPTTSILTYQDFANWLQCRIAETIDHHEEEWGDDGFSDDDELGSTKRYVTENLNGQTSFGRVIALMYLITGNLDYHQRTTEIAMLVENRLNYGGINVVTVNGVTKQFYSWRYGWGANECFEDPGHAYLTMQFAEICNQYNITHVTDGYQLFDDTDMERFANTFAHVMYKVPLQMWQSTAGDDNEGFECGKGGGAQYSWLAKYNPYIFQIQSDGICQGAIYGGGHLTVLSELTLLQSKNNLSNTLDGENFKFNPVAVRRGNSPISNVFNLATGDFDNNGMQDFISVDGAVDGESIFYSYTPEICDNPNIFPSNCWVVAQSNAHGVVDWKGMTGGNFDLGLAPGDHQGDELIALHQDGSIYVLKQIGSTPGGTFVEEILPSAINWAGLSSSDFIPSNIGDEAIGISTTGQLYFISYDALGIQLSGLIQNTGVVQPIGITAGKFDADDNRPQIAVLDGSNSLIYIYAYDNLANLFFEIGQSTVASTFQQWTNITSGDFDGDNIDEVVVHRNIDGQMLIFKMKDIGFVQIYGEFFPVDQSIGALASGKFNLNSDNDELIVFRNFDGQITIFNIEGHCPNLYLDNLTINTLYAIDNPVAVPAMVNDYPIDYHVDNTLVSGNGFVVATGSTVDFSAGTAVVLKTGTSILPGSTFHAYIEPSLACGDDLFLKTANATIPPNKEELNSKNEIPSDEIPVDVIFSATIFPNPSDGSFVLQLTGINQNQPTQIGIFNSFGEMVYESTTTNARTTFDLKNQAKGIYFVKVQSEGNVVVSRVVIQ